MFIAHFEINKFVSSTNNMVFDIVVTKQLLCKYILNNLGPKNGPCGTPQVISSDSELLNLTGTMFS